MKYVVHKVYWDFEKEERWLNSMAAKGFALVDVSWCRYLFEECEKGAYTYRIELLDRWPTNPESVAYIRFLEESGVDCVCTITRWAYFRKRTEEGAFEIYSDFKSKMRHYGRISLLWLSLALINIFAGALNILLGIMAFVTRSYVATINYTCAGISFAIAIGLLILFFRLHKKTRRLRSESLVQE